MKYQIRLITRTLFLAFIASLLVVPGSESLAKQQAAPSVTDKNLDIITYYPDIVLLGNDDIIYLLSRDISKVFRWSISDRDYLPTISLSGSPEFMTYSSQTNRLYLGYPYRVTQIELDNSINEEAFIYTGWKIRGLATANQYVFVNRETGSISSGTYYIYNPDGTLAYSTYDNCSICFYAKEFEWSETTNRMYVLTDFQIPIDLVWMQIDATGTITNAQDSPYHGNETFQYPIRISPDGTIALLGTGHIYDAISLVHTNSLTTTIEEATWSGNYIFTLRSSEENTKIQKWDENFHGQTTRTIKGAPIQIFSSSEGLVAVTYHSNQPWFWILDSDLDVIFVYPTIYYAYFPIIQKPYPIYIPPGIYPVDRCVNSPLVVSTGYVGTLTECIPRVEIQSDGFMRFYFVWIAHLTSVPSVTKYSDAENPNMYIKDNLLNRYDHVEVGGAAAQNVTMYNDIPVEGWFLFIPAKQGADTFSFYDDDQNVVIENIKLIP
jgi:hypothetical protein